jgi:hypothetical protein
MAVLTPAQEAQINFLTGVKEVLADLNDDDSIEELAGTTEPMVVAMLYVLAKAVEHLLEKESPL